MKNPWLDVPLADYEGHMALPGIEQAQLLADILAGTLEQFLPQSVAVLGCAGGNGFERIASGVTRVVGVDINPRFVAEAGARFGGRLKNLELIVGDIQDDEVSFEPVDLIFAGLVLEYVNVEVVVARTASMLTAAGRLVTVLQLPSESHGQVSPSPFSSVQSLAEVMHLVPPSRLQKAAKDQGYTQMASRRVASRGGKCFQVQVFRLERARQE
ncbi:MAG: class I SAM-dependent methyltransferase [Terriglobia bacterium]